ncbi:beta-galactosidase [Gracilaria domingensis]|nr:beta-galactosidase [Gracilaria domingensis]
MPRQRQVSRTAPHVAIQATPQQPAKPSTHRTPPPQYLFKFSLASLLYAFLIVLALFLLISIRSPSVLYRPRSIIHGAYSAATSQSVRSSPALRLSYDERNFTLNGRPIRLVSGSVHYFRTTPSHWLRILQYGKAMGLNAIETYIPWNLHEPSPAHFRFAGILDLRYFLEAAHHVGLLVLLRPGPFICSEWDLGGLPAYLLADPSMRLRSMHPSYLAAVERYFDAVAEQIRPYIGKPIVALQIENEFGAYAADDSYMNWILNQWKTRGFSSSKLLFFTSDNGGPKTVLRGSPFQPSAKVLKTINLEVRVAEKIQMLRDIQPDAPAMIAEFWTGWFDHWGEYHHERDGEDVASHIDSVLNAAHASINLYMFFGGTNFGFMSGANIEPNMTYAPTTTSYDYDAFVTEHADIRNNKFKPMRRVIREFWNSLGDLEMVNASMAELPASPYMSAYAGTVLFTESIPLYDVLDIVTDDQVASTYPLTMEQLGFGYGYIMYRYRIDHSITPSSNTRVLQMSGVRDFAYVLADGQVVRTVDRNKQFESDGETLKKIHIPIDTSHLDIIVENRGRVNYGQYIHDRKGILGNITLDGQVIEGFDNLAMSFPQDHPLLPDVYGNETISKLRTRMAGVNAHPPLATRSSPPTFFRGEMSINPGSMTEFGGEYPGTYCRVFGRGVLWVNGFNVGRFHTGVSGPQRSLFVPGAMLREGRNEFVVLHMNMHLTRDPPKLQLFDKPDYGPASPL